MFYAHSLVDKRDRGDWHSLRDHLTATGRQAAFYADEFGAKNAAEIAGLLHDLGKYSAKFQERLSGSAESVDHATAGALEVRKIANTPADKLAAELIAYVIAGHHAGLADFHSLQERLNKSIEPIDTVWRQEIEIPNSPIWPHLAHFSKETAAFQLAFLGRMIFSCLVDADYKDTEAFYARHEQKLVDRDWPDLRTHVDALIAKFNAYMAVKQQAAELSDLNSLRTDILQHVRGKAGESAGLFTLTVPTGGGKTLASLGFALDHAKARGLRRIVYAIPFAGAWIETTSPGRQQIGRPVAPFAGAWIEKAHQMQRCIPRQVAED